MSTPKFSSKRNLVMSPKVTKNATLVVRPLGPHLRSNSNTTRGTDSTSHSSGDDHQLVVDPKPTPMSLRQKVIPFHAPDEHDLDGFSQYGAFGDFSEVDFAVDPSREAFQATSLSDAWGQPLSNDDFVIQDDGESEYEEEEIDDEEYEAYMASQTELQMSQGDLEYIEEWVPVESDDEEFEEVTVASEEYDAYLQHLVGDGEANGCAGEVLAIIGRELKVEKTSPVDTSSKPPKTKGVEEKKKKVKKKEHKDKKDKGSEKVKSKKSSSSSSSNTSKLQSSASSVKTPKSPKKKPSSSEEPKVIEKTKKTTKLSIPKSSSKTADCSLSVKTPDSESPLKRHKKTPSVSLSPSTPEEEVKQALESSTNSLRLSKKTKESKTKKIKTHKSTSTASHDGTTGKELSPSRSTKESRKEFSLPLKSSSNTSKIKKPKSFSHMMDDCSHSVFSVPLESKSKKRSSSKKSTDSVGGCSSRSILSAPALRSSSKTLKSRKDRLERRNARLGIVDNSASLASLSSKLKKSAKSGSSVSETKKIKSSKTENEALLKSPTKLTKVGGSKSSKVSTKEAGDADTSKSHKVSTKVAGTKDASKPLKVSTAEARAKDASKVHTASKAKISSSKSTTMEVEPTVGQESPRRSVRLIKYQPAKAKG